MTGTASFCFVDVFAGLPLTGNPLSLVIDADHLPEPRGWSGPRVRVGGSGLVVAQGTLNL